MRHLSESILSKKTGQYRSKIFPLNPPTRDELVKWLEDNGYELIVPSLPDTAYWPSKVLRDAKRNNKKLYAIGIYKGSDPSKKHITFSDGVYCFRIYTEDIDGHPFRVYDNTQVTPIEKYMSFDEFRKQVKKYLGLK